MQLLPIESAPLDGTEVYLYNEKYPCMPLAAWEEQGWTGGGGVKRVTYPGWCFDSVLRIGDSWGFLGLPEDIEDGLMPTHWLPVPTKEGV